MKKTLSTRATLKPTLFLKQSDEDNSGVSIHMHTLPIDGLTLWTMRGQSIDVDTGIHAGMYTLNTTSSDRFALGKTHWIDISDHDQQV